MLKRSKSDNEIDSENADAAGDSVLVINPDQDICELVARLLEHAGLAATRSPDLAGALPWLEEGRFAAVVVDSLGGNGIADALQVLEDVRNGSAEVRDTAVIILAAGDTNRLYAFQNGVDGYVVRPFHADEMLAEVHAVLARSVDERLDHRQTQLMGGATTS